MAWRNNSQTEDVYINVNLELCEDFGPMISWWTRQQETKTIRQIECLIEAIRKKTKKKTQIYVEAFTVRCFIIKSSYMQMYNNFPECS